MQNRAIWIAVGVVAALSVALIVVSILLSSGAGPADTRTVGTDEPEKDPVPTPGDNGGGPRPKGSLDGTTWTLPDGTTVDLANENQGMVDCLTENCKTSPNEANFGMCQRRECKIEGQTLTIDGAGATLAGGTFAVDLKLGGLSGHYGAFPADPIWVGVTLSDGSKERDLEPIQVAMKDTAAPVHFEAKDVGEGWKSFVVAAWGRKRTPCPTPRDGCERYGFALEQLLGSYPSDAYDGGKLKYASF